MTKCTDPQQWMAAPGSNAPEEDVARYLAHLEECAFHAAIEQRETAKLRTVLAFAGSEPGVRSLPEPEAAVMRDELDRLGTIRRKVFISELSIRVDGSERARLNLLEASRITLGAAEGALIGVWKPSRPGEENDDELYLTTHLLRARGSAPGEKIVSSTMLEGGQRISFTVEPGVDSKALLTVAYAETRWPRALRLSLARLKHRLMHRAPEARWSPALKLTAVLLALLAALALLPFLLSRRDGPTQIAVQADKPAPVEVPVVKEPAQAPAPSTSVPQSTNINGETPSPPPKRNGADVTAARPPMTLAKVRRVYVGEGEGDYHQRLRAAVIAQLRESGRFTVVSREQEADAVLMSEWTRSAAVRVQLLNRDGKALWFTTQQAAGESTEDVSETAARIVRELSDKAGQPAPRAPIQKR